MPKREKLLSELKDEKDYGIFLAAQMGGVPNELQLIIQTAQLDSAKGGLRPRSQYVVRVLGIAEHRMSLGIFGRLFFSDDHPILFHHNELRKAIHFEGKPKDVNELVLDIHQAYVTTFGPWRELATDINREKPLVDLLVSGTGRLGIMPQPAAERMVRVLQHHGMTAHLEEQDGYEKEDEHGRSRLRKLLGIDDSYFVALDFTVDEMGKI
jgi:hypothetical protein